MCCHVLTQVNRGGRGYVPPRKCIPLPTHQLECTPVLVSLNGGALCAFVFVFGGRLSVFLNLKRDSPQPSLHPPRVSWKCTTIEARFMVTSENKLFGIKATLRQSQVISTRLSVNTFSSANTVTSLIRSHSPSHEGALSREFPMC